MILNINPKIVYSDYCPKSGISTVILYNPNNQKYYSGLARLHPDDKEYSSQNFGCILAEHRAARKMYKDELKNLLYVKKYVEQSGGFRKTKAQEKLNNQIKMLKEKIQCRTEPALKVLASNRITSIIQFRKNMKNFKKSKEERTQKLKTLAKEIIKSTKG